MAAYGVILRSPGGPSQKNSVTRWSGDLFETQQYYHLVLSEGGWAGRVFKKKKKRQASGFAFDSVVHFFFFGDQLYILFWWILPPICTLSIHCRRAKQKWTRDWKKSCFLFFFFESLQFMSKDLYMIVCSKKQQQQQQKCPFFFFQVRWSNEQLSKPCWWHKVISLAQNLPVSRDVTEWMRAWVLRARYEIINFFTGVIEKWT